MTDGFYHCYREHRLSAASEEVVHKANAILSDMRAQGYVLTLRQLYYQFVRRNWIKNEEREYKRLGRLVTNARESGRMDWMAIEDRGRGVRGRSYQEDPADLLDGIEFGLNFDRWARQDTYLEVWVEKQALESVISRPCSARYVRYMACKGYLSASEAWRAGLRFQEALRRGKRPVLIHLADHDPSGLNMTDDNRSRVRLFAESHGVEVRRIALNMDQVNEYGPPPNPAKESDSRAKEYVQQYGPHSWELDALEPSVLDGLIRDTIDEYRDPDIWDDVVEQETEARKPLKALGKNWAKVEEFLYREGLV